MTTSSNAPALFIAGTDTDIGKTWITALTLAYFRRQGINARVQKWATSGCDGFSPDVRLSNDHAGVMLAREDEDTAAPYSFPLPASPHLAAENARTAVDMDRVRRAYDEYRARCELLIIEGVGGLCVPLTRETLLIDVTAEYKIPTLLVARSTLGTINHTLLSLEALRRRDIPVIGVVLNTVQPGNPDIIADNRRVIEELGGAAVLGTLPHAAALTDLTAPFDPIGSRLAAALNFTA